MRFLSICTSSISLLSHFHLKAVQASFLSSKVLGKIPFQISSHDKTMVSKFSSSSSLSSHNQQHETSSTTSMEVVMDGPELSSIPPMSKRLFLVRHGEVINPGGDKSVYYGAMDVSLSPLGELEAKAAGMYLKQFNLQYVASSPLSRAIFGANQVIDFQKESDNTETKNHDLKIYPGFTELDRGSWCGKTKEEIGEEMMNRFDACDESITPDGGESYPTLKKRVLQARDELLKEMQCGKASAIVSHLQVTRSILSDALGIPTDQMSKLKVATASVTCIDYDSVTGEQTVHFQSFKPDAGLKKSKDGAN